MRCSHTLHRGAPHLRHRRSFLRPLYYDWPEDDAAYTSKDEYLFGDQMLVAPVTAPADKVTGLATEKVWLPKGEWIEWPTGKHFTGPIAVDRSFSIDQTPVYLRAGAIVPMQPPMLLHRRKAGGPADRECLAARARHELQLLGL